MKQKNKYDIVVCGGFSLDNADILRPLFEKGDLQQTMDLAAMEHKKIAEVSSEGMNFVTASILADIPSVDKTILIQKVGALFSAKEYCELLNAKLFTLPPERRESLKNQGIPLTRENISQYLDWYNIFDIAFPWLPLSVFEDFVVYLKKDKKLELDSETKELVKEKFLNSKKYSERELSRFFESSLFDDGI